MVMLPYQDAPPISTLLPRQRFRQRLAALRYEREPWLSHYRDLSDQFQPRKARFTFGNGPISTKGLPRGSRRNETIINGVPIRASEVLANGMLSSLVSPVRPWFKLGTAHPERAESSAAKEWLHHLEEFVRSVCANSRSNFYDSAANAMGDMAVFGTTAVHMDDDLESIVRCYHFPVGSYYLANSPTLEVDTVYREVSLTVAQVIRKFGMARCSEIVQAAYRRGQFDMWVPLLHVIEPNDEYTQSRYGPLLGPTGKQWRSCWMELNGPDDLELLYESGYYEFPVLASRWHVIGEDVYGMSPAMNGLGDCKALQFLERRKGRLLDKLTDPPMNAPASMANQGGATTMAGQTNYYDSSTAGQKIEPAVVMPPQALEAIEQSIEKHEQRIGRALYSDLWLAMEQVADGRATATEVQARLEEKMLQLGAVSQRVQTEFLAPAVKRIIRTGFRRGLLPPAPPELLDGHPGANVEVEFLSIFTQAQKLTNVDAVRQFAGFVMQMAQFKPDALFKLNSDAAIDLFADAIGVPPEAVNDDQTVEQLKQQAAQAQQQAQGQQAMLAASQGVKNLSQADTGSDNALTRLLQANTGGTYVPTGGAA